MLCGQADTLWFLVLARVLQGARRGDDGPGWTLGAAADHPAAGAVAAMAWLTTPALVGPVLGPPVGGFIVTYFSWRWIFDINVPIGLIGVILVSLFVEEVREPPAGKFDLVGLLLSGGALSGLMAGLETAGRGVVPTAATVARWRRGDLPDLGIFCMRGGILRRCSISR